MKQGRGVVSTGRDARERLRKYSVQPALRRGEPFYASMHLAPAQLVSGFLVGWHERQIERVSVAQVDARVRHGGGVYA
jgi:hypothetical protein